MTKELKIEFTKSYWRITDMTLTVYDDNLKETEGLPNNIPIVSRERKDKQTIAMTDNTEYVLANEKEIPF